MRWSASRHRPCCSLRTTAITEFRCRAAGPGVKRYEARTGEAPLSCRDVLAAWQHSPAFRRAFIATLAAAPWEAFRWETPGVRAETLDQPFRFVLIDAPELRVGASPAAFSEHFPPTGCEVTAFRNLGGDALLVVPCPPGDGPAARAACSHLAAFCRGAPAPLQHALWQRVADELCALLEAPGRGTVWLSTAGAGVPWLHVRLDDRPKYYAYAPFAAAAAK